MTIKAIIFDVGGVLVRTQDRSSRRAWEKRLGLAEWALDEIVFGGEMGARAQRGEVADEALWQWVGQRLNLEPEQLQACRRGFWAGDALDEELVDLIRRLRRRYQMAIISNATDSLRRVLKTTYPIADAFDLIVCSAEEGVAKPDPRIFELTLERLGRRPEETVFIDDFERNVTAARSLGMQAIHYRPGMDVAAELARLGVEVSGEARLFRS